MKTIRRMLTFLAPFWKEAAVSVLLGVATVLSAIGLLGTSAFLIARAAQQPSVAELQVAIVGVRFFGISRGVFRYLERLSSHSVNFRLLARLRVWLYERLEPLAPAGFRDQSGGDLLARTVADIDTLENFYVRAFYPPFIALIVSGGMSLYLGRMDWRLGLTALAGLAAVGALLPVWIFLSARNSGGEVVARRAANQRELVEGLQGMQDIRAFGLEEEWVQRLSAQAWEMSRAQQRVLRVGAAGNALGHLGMYLTVCASLVISLRLVSGGRIDPVSLTVAIILTLASFEAVLPLSGAAQHLNSSLAAARRLFEVVDLPAPVTEPVEPQPLPAGAHLKLEHVSVTRPDGGAAAALEDISLDLPAGKKMAVVGESGAGKSTLAETLLRFLPVSAGDYTLAGRSVTETSSVEIRGRIGWISQKSYLFAGSLKKNLLLARPEAREEELWEAIEQARLGDFVRGLPEGLKTWVGEHGVRLSGGERQRLALARAILKRAEILLLDEPTAHLDPVTEQEVLDAVFTNAQGRSLVWITHRLARMEAMDEILVMRGGKIIERGAHARLLRAGGWYAEMYRLQSIE